MCAILSDMKSLRFIAIILFLLILAGGYYKVSISRPASRAEEVVPVTIEQGQGVSAIATQLDEEGLIRSPFFFKLYIQLHGLGNSLQAGDYEVPRNASTVEVVELLQHGTFDVRLTFLEGWRVEEYADYLSGQSGLPFSGVDFLSYARQFEGRLFPDTYVVPRYISVRDFVDLMVSNFNQQIDDDLRTAVDASGLTLEEVVTIASLVERETNSTEGRPLVAGILLKRLENEWPLQVDATVQYVLGYQTETDPENGDVRSSWWKEGLTVADLAIDSPYNTRVVSGLPPGPISNPGIESIRAVLFPEPSAYWYYISDTEGGMHYATTLDEHNANVASIPAVIMKNRTTLTLTLVLLLLAFSTVVAFPRVPLSFTVGSFSVDRTIGADAWHIPFTSIVRDLRIKQGLDLQGGVQVVYAVDMSEIAESDHTDAFEAVRAIIDRRVNFFGVSEANIQTARAGDEYRIIVELPGVTEVEQALGLIGRTAQLEFRELPSDDVPVELAPDQFISTGLTGAHLKKSTVQFDQTDGSAVVGISFDNEGTRLFKEITERSIGEPLAIFLDDQLLTAPVVSQPLIDGQGVITGQFTPETAKELSIQLNSGALPAPVTIVEQRTIGASLGAESVRLSIVAGLVGLLLVVLFMWLLYGTLGFIAVLALLAYTLITLMLYKLIPITLTLPGIAGFILSVGMAVDANILIFERLKEEVHRGVKGARAIELAFGRAWDSIRDANVNTLLICFILFNPFNWQFLNTSGLVRGFAVTLALGIFVSLFTGIVVVRSLIRIFYAGYRQEV